VFCEQHNSALHEEAKQLEYLPVFRSLLQLHVDTVEGLAITQFDR
jgi:hypothetical protein